MSQPSVEDKVILVTGGGAGFGRCIAQQLAAHGARVVITDLSADAAQATAAACGAAARSAVHDVASETDWDRVIAEVATAWGRLDGLVNNAGYMLTKPYLQTSLAEYRRMQQVNVESIWIGVQKAYPLLLEGVRHSASGAASVVNISSIFGQVAGFAHAAYGASKGAVRTLTKCQAVEFARAGSGIRVNSVHPGPGNTALATNGIKEMLAAGLTESAEQAIDHLNSLIPVGRFAEPEDIGNLVHFLCSDASRYFTGAEFTIDGGYTAI